MVNVYEHLFFIVEDDRLDQDSPIFSSSFTIIDFSAVAGLPIPLEDLIGT